MHLNRRWFLQGSLFSGAGLLLGCGDTAAPGGAEVAAGGADGGIGGGGAGGAGPLQCLDQTAAGRQLGAVDFKVVPSIPLDTKFGRGWDARLYQDLSTLSADSLVVPSERFFIRTEYPDNTDESKAWSLRLHGLVAAERSLTMADLEPLATEQGVHLLECSGNSAGGGFGLLSAAAWSGVPLAEVLKMVTADASATQLLVSGFDDHSVPSAGGHSTPGAAWVFSFDELIQAGAFLATSMNGEPLPKDHGAPVRLLVPGWYGCCNIKWVDEMRFVDESEPATSQMQEFASRTHQSGVPTLARDYRPATMDQAAMPVRVEQWQLDGEMVYRLVGVMWGGNQPTDKLQISFDFGGSWQPVEVCPAQTTNSTWTLWQYLWRPGGPGEYTISMGIDDPEIPTGRLDSGWYQRAVIIDAI